MGTYLSINASDQALEQIADVPAGTCATIAPLHDAYAAKLMAPSTDADDIAFIDEYEAAVAALHPNATALCALLYGEAFGKLQALDIIAEAGLDASCGSVNISTPQAQAFAVEILQLQRRQWGRRSVIRLGLAEHRAEYAAVAREQRRLCARTIDAVRRGDVTTLCWG